MIFSDIKKTLKIFDTIDNWIIKDIFEVIPDELWDYFDEPQKSENEIMYECYEVIKSYIENLLLDFISRDKIGNEITHTLYYDLKEQDEINSLMKMKLKFLSINLKSMININDMMMRINSN